MLFRLFGSKVTNGRHTIFVLCDRFNQKKNLKKLCIREGSNMPSLFITNLVILRWSIIHYFPLDTGKHCYENWYRLSKIRFPDLSSYLQGSHGNVSCGDSFYGNCYHGNGCHGNDHHVLT